MFSATAQRERSTRNRFSVSALTMPGWVRPSEDLQEVATPFPPCRCSVRCCQGRLLQQMAVTVLAVNALLNQSLELFTVLRASTVRTSMKQQVSPSTQCHRSSDARKPPQNMGWQG